MTLSRRALLTAAMTAAISAPVSRAYADYNGPDNSDTIEPEDSGSFYPAYTPDMFRVPENDGNGIYTAIFKFAMTQDEIWVHQDLSSTFDIEVVTYGFNTPPDGWGGASISSDNYLPYTTLPETAQERGALIPRIIGIDVTSIVPDTVYTVQVDFFDLPTPRDGWASVSFEWVLRDWNVRERGDHCDSLSPQSGATMCGTEITRVSLSDMYGVYLGFEG